MTKSVYVLGAGGHGRVVLDTLLTSGVKVIGLLDPNITVGDYVFGVPILGSPTFLDDITVSDVLLVNGLGVNSNTNSRKRIFEVMKMKGFAFSSIQHTSAVIGRDCTLGDGSQIMAGGVLQNRVRIGLNTVVNTHASIDHDCVISAHAFISPSVVLCGNVRVSESAFIGAGAVVLPGIQIATNTVVGAGAVVTKDVPERWVVSGNPAIKIGEKR